MSNASTIRPAALDDMPACAAILNQWIDATDWMPRVHPPDDVERHYREFVFREREVFIAGRGAEIAGYICLSDDNHVTSFFVKADLRSGGLGRTLLNHAKGLRPNGLKLWTFVANTDARRFYGREGFIETECSDGDNEEKLPDILYAWQGDG